MAGIVAYGVALPKRRLRSSDIHATWRNVAEDVLEKFAFVERCVPGPDEDPITLGVDSARRCLEQAGREPGEVDGLVFGSCTNPYSTKAAATVVGEALGLPNGIFSTDVQFGGRSGSDALTVALALVGSGMARRVLAVASDCLSRHVPPGHVYEYSASAGAVSFLVSAEETVAEVEGISYWASDRADWFRVAGERYLQLGGGFVGHMSSWGLVENLLPAWKELVRRTGLDPASLQYAAVPQSTGVMPLIVATRLELDMDVVLPWVLTASVGDVGSAGVPLSLCHVLDNAGPGEKVVVLVYGWGGGATAMLLHTTQRLPSLPGRPSVMPEVERGEYVDYSRALKYEHKLLRPDRGLSGYY